MPARRHLVHCLLLLPAVAAAAQAPSAPLTLATPSPATPRPAARQLVFLDAAHGGDDTGARLSAGGPGTDQLLEKDITLALSNRLRFQLDALGIAVLATRESEALPAAATPAGTPVAPTQPPSTDQRAGLANHAHPFACIVLHATGSGTGVHILTAALPPEPPQVVLDRPLTIPPPLHWDTAQADSLPQSERLATEIATALTQAGLPVNRGRASIRPLNNLTCPAVLVELAPLSRTQGPTDVGYQARVTQALATALVFWRSHSGPNPAPDPTSGSSNATTGAAPNP